MSTEAIVKEESKQKKEPLFSKKTARLISHPLDLDNPITVQMLGICSVLAVTTQIKPAFVMSVSMTVVTACSSVVISLIRTTLPSRIRIIVQLAIVSLWVILVDQVLKAFMYEMSKQLSVFIGLIITNCIVMGRLEAFSLSNKPWPSFLDGLGNGFGYGLILISLAVLREVLGSGAFLGFKIFDALGVSYTGNGLVLLPAGACILLGLIIWIQRSINGYREAS